MTTQTAEPKFKVKATSLTSQTSIILPRTVSQAPVVLYTPVAWFKIQKAIMMCPDEVGWLGLVEENEEEREYLVTDIFVPSQVVSGTETDIAEDAMSELACTLESPEKLRYWGHSHVNMGVGPSVQDEEQTAEYLEHVDYFIRGIYNKKGASKVDVFDMKNEVQYQCVKNELYLNPLSEEEMKTFEDGVKENVKKYRTYNNQSTTTGGWRDPAANSTSSSAANLAGRQSRSNPFVVGKVGV